MKVILGIAILTVLMAGLVLWFSPSTLKPIIKSSIEKFGFSNVSLGNIELGTGSVSLQSLEMTWEKRGLELHLENLVVGFSAASFSAATIESIKLENLDIGLANKPTGPALPNPELVLELDHREWLSKLPLKSVVVNRLRIGQPDHWLYDLQVQLDRTSAGAVIIQVDDNNSQLRADVIATETGQLSISLAPDGELALLEAHLSPLGENSRLLEFKGELNRLEQYFKHSSGTIIDKSCHFAGAVRLSSNPLDRLVLQISSPACFYNDTQLGNFNFAGHFENIEQNGFRSVFPVQIHLDLFKRGSVEMSNLQAMVPVRLELTEENLIVTLDTKGRFSINQINISDNSLTNVSGEFGKPMQILPHFYGEEISLDMGEMNFGNSRVAPFSAKSTFTEQKDRNYSLTLDIPQLRSTQGTNQFGFSDTQIKAQIKAGDLSGNARSKLEDSVQFSVDFIADSNKGNLQVKSESLDLGKTDQGIAGLFNAWPDKMNLVSGAIQVDANISWQKKDIKSDLVLKLVNVGGFYAGSYFSGLESRASINLLPILTSDSFIPFELSSLDAGLAVENISGQIQLEEINDKIQAKLKDISASVFGGKASIADFVLHPDNETILLTLDLKALNLNQLAGNQQFPGLDMSGTISGSIPIRISKGEINVDSGQIHNDGAGVIRYDVGGDGATGMSGAGILFKALKKFEFSVLTAEPVYHRDGTLILKLHLEGISEEIGRQQPIHFNINLEQNILSLLESVRLVNGLHENIDQRVKQFYERQSQSQLQ